MPQNLSMSRRAALIGLGTAAGAVALAPRGPARAQPATPPTNGSRPTVSEVATGLTYPWSIAFLSDGRMLVTEKAGRLRIVARDGSVSEPVTGLPEVLARGQGGLLEVAVSPRFARDRRVFLSYAEPTEQGGRTAVASAVLDGLSLRSRRVIFRQKPDASGSAHWGGKLAFDRDGHLFVTLGDRFALRDRAQDLTTHLGKIVRIRADGGVPRDNPFVSKPDALPEIWSYGHRNVQGAALHPRTGELWTHEHGPQGGDEVNIARSGRNYGWPLVTQGREYGSGAPIGDGATGRAGIEAPLKAWVPSVAPSGMTFVSGDVYPAWRGDLLVGTLRARTLLRLRLDGDRIVDEERLLQDVGERIRDVRQGPDGLLYLVTDAPAGRILRLQPERG